MIVRLMYKSCITIRTLNSGKYGIFLIMDKAGFISATVVVYVDPRGLVFL